MDIVLIKRDVVSGLEIEISGKYSFPFIWEFDMLYTYQI
jgi:hypothetical protein